MTPFEQIELLSRKYAVTMEDLIESKNIESEIREIDSDIRYIQVS